MRRILLLLGVIALAAGPAAGVGGRANRPPAEILRPPAESATLDAKSDWALKASAKYGTGRGFWVGYSIERLMGENSHIGSFTDGGSGRDLTVEELLAGKKSMLAPAGAGEDVRVAAKAALDDIERQGKPEKKVLKELGLFFKYEAGKPPVLTEAHMSNLDLAFDFEGAPLFWLGKTPEEQSLALIRALDGPDRGDKVREGLIAAAGCHGSPRLVVSFLEGAVFSISQVELPEAADELIALARNAEFRDSRKQAVFWLGQIASEKAGKALEEFARKDGDIEIQEQAVFALSQLPDNQGVDALIKLAKTHPDPRVRKKAVFWLGECDDPRALETLIAIIKGK
jgi:hypothetical protein